MSPYTLTHIVYGLIAVVVLAVATYFAVYMRKQKAAQERAERGGARPHSTEEGILMGQEQARREAAKK